MSRTRCIRRENAPSCFRRRSPLARRRPGRGVRDSPCLGSAAGGPRGARTTGFGGLLYLPAVVGDLTPHATAPIRCGRRADPHEGSHVRCAVHGSDRPLPASSRHAPCPEGVVQVAARRAIDRSPDRPAQFSFRTGESCGDNVDVACGAVRCQARQAAAFAPRSVRLFCRWSLRQG